MYKWQRQKRYPNSGEMFDSNGNRVDVASLADRMSNALDVFNHLQVAEYTPMVEHKPLPAISMVRNKTVPSDSSDVSVVNGEIQIDGSITNTALYTVDTGRYLPGLIGLAGIGVRVPNTSVGNYKYGYGNDQGNRIGLEIDNGEWYTFIQSGGNTYYRKPRSQWIDPLDGTGPSGLTLSLNSHVLRIPIGWYGYLSIVWMIAVPQTGGDKLIMVDVSAGEGVTGVSIEQPDLPIFAEANGGVMYVGGRHYGVYGRYAPQVRFTCSPAVTKTVGTSFVPVVSFKSKATEDWQGVSKELEGAGVLTTADTEVAFFIYPDLTGFNFVDFSDIDPQETTFQIDTSATALANGYKTFSYLVSGGSGNKTELSSKDLPNIKLSYDVIITMAARSLSGTADVTAIMKAKEEW